MRFARLRGFVHNFHLLLKNELTCLLIGGREGPAAGSDFLQIEAGADSGEELGVAGLDDRLVIFDGESRSDALLPNSDGIGEVALNLDDELLISVGEKQGLEGGLETDGLGEVEIAEALLEKIKAGAVVLLEVATLLGA